MLVQENARLQTKVKEQETVIAEQKAHIAELETQVAEQLAKIAALTQSLEKCHAQIEEDARKITDLSDKMRSSLILSKPNAFSIRKQSTK